MRQEIICIDFDGVIHHYCSGWQGPCEIPDDPVEGAFDWLELLILDPDLKPVIYSSRSKEPGGVEAMRAWFNHHGFVYTDYLEFPTQKPAANMTIDDRAFCFQGDFPSPNWLKRFQPWHKLEKMREKKDD